MPIRFRCLHCRGLMSISTRRVGATVACPICGADVVVPDRDDVALPGPVAAADDSTASATGSPHEDDQGSVAQGPPFVRAEPLVPAPRYEPDLTPLPSGPETEEDDDETPGLKLRSRRFADEEMDLTSMVDVVFQLLIFFMVTASFSLQKSIEVPSPDQPKQGVAQALQQLDDLQDLAILVTIDDRNVVSVDDEPLGDISELPDILRERMRRDRKSELILTAARNATHRTVISVIDAANVVGMQRIRMATSARPSE